MYTIVAQIKQIDIHGSSPLRENEERHFEELF
jgi:hypothetical protein